MRLLALVIALVALLGLMVYTNPSLDDFGNYVRQYVIQEAQQKGTDPLRQLLESIMGGLAGSLLKSQAVRTDYLFFSLYEVRLGEERLRALGIFRNFLLLEKPDLKRYQTGEVTANGRFYT